MENRDVFLAAGGEQYHYIAALNARPDHVAALRGTDFKRNLRMLWLKAFHIIGVVSWFAALLYLPRLFVYHAQIQGAPSTMCGQRALQGHGAQAVHAHVALPR